MTSDENQEILEKESQVREAETLSEVKRARSKGTTSGKIGIIFLVAGILSLTFSIIYSLQVPAFIGLSLTFWGALFILIRSSRYVEASVLDSTAVPSYSMIDRIVKDMKYKGKSYYIPPYPKDVYLPEHLKGLKDMIVFISAETDAKMPSIEEMAKGKFLLENPKGILVTPPGLGLLNQFEKELKMDASKLQLNELCEILPKTIIDDFHLAREIRMETKEDQIHLKIVGSEYANLYTDQKDLKSIHFLGCPIVSAIASAIAKNTGKIVTIQKEKISPDGQTLEVSYSIVRG